MSIVGQWSEAAGKMLESIVEGRPVEAEALFIHDIKKSVSRKNTHIDFTPVFVETPLPTFSWDENLKAKWNPVIELLDLLKFQPLIDNRPRDVTGENAFKDLRRASENITGPWSKNANLKDAVRSFIFLTLYKRHNTVEHDRMGQAMPQIMGEFSQRFQDTFGIEPDKITLFHPTLQLPSRGNPARAAAPTQRLEAV